MKTRYIDLVDQVFDFPSPEFGVKDNELFFRDIDLMGLVREYGTPLKLHYLPRITENIQRAKKWFADAFEKVGYEGTYNYCYCTKSSHFSFVLHEVLKNGANIETSSAYDLDILKILIENGKLDPSKPVICNGFKTESYLEKINEHLSQNVNIVPVLDNFMEADALAESVEYPCSVGIRIASEEEPKFAFYTSRLGVGYKDVIGVYKHHIAKNKNLKLKMLHFFINTGIRDTAYYWSELNKCIRAYCKLRKEVDTLDSLNIGGGFPIKHSLNFDYDYEYMIEEILYQIKKACDEEGVPVPHIYTEFGSFTVGEAGATLFKILYQKKQNDREKWNMIDGSFMTALPDTWAINQRFMLFPLNRWDSDYERVLLGGLSCDSDDYYNSEQHSNAIFMPKFSKDKPLYIGFFNTGAYQENIGGYGGLEHCLIPDPKHLVIDRNEDGTLDVEVFSERQSSDRMMELLGYK